MSVRLRCAILNLTLILPPPPQKILELIRKFILYVWSLCMYVSDYWRLSVEAVLKFLLSTKKSHGIAWHYGWSRRGSDFAYFPNIPKRHQIQIKFVFNTL